MQIRAHMQIDALAPISSGHGLNVVVVLCYQSLICGIHTETPVQKLVVFFFLFLI